MVNCHRHRAPPMIAGRLIYYTITIFLAKTDLMTTPEQRALASEGAANEQVVAQKNASVRISMLSRGRAPAGAVGSSNAVCAVKHARPSCKES